MLYNLLETLANVLDSISLEVIDGVTLMYIIFNDAQ